MPRDLERELDEQSNQWPDSWRPRDGEILCGRVVRYATGPTKYGTCHTCILERDDGARVSVWLSSTVLLDLFRKERPKVGERVGIKSLGKHPEKGYRRWSLVVDRPDAEPDFSPLGGEDAEPTRRGDRGGPYVAATMSPERDQTALPARLREPAARCAPAPPPDDADPFAW
jgi:hypothetical protein